VQNIDQLHAYECYQNVTEPEATEYHTQKVHVYNTRTESGLAKACCAQAGPAHATGHVEMAWTDESWHALPVAPNALARRSLSPVTGTVSQATKTNGIERLPCSYLCHSQH